MDLIKVESKNSIRTVTLNRPDLHNAFNPQMIEDLTECFKTASDDDSIRAILLKGSGRSFCAGADLSWMKSMIDYDLEKNRADSYELYDMFAAIESCPKPVVGLVHGNVYGGGLGLVAACDIVAAEDKTRFCFSEVKLGLAPAVISSFVLRKATPGRAREWMLSGRVFSAAEAMAAGLVSFTGSSIETAVYADKVASGFLAVGPEAVSACKKLLLALPDLDEEARREHCTSVIADLRVGGEGQEGLKAFLEKRSPSWKLES